MPKPCLNLLSPNSANETAATVMHHIACVYTYERMHHYNLPIIILIGRAQIRARAAPHCLTHFFLRLRLLLLFNDVDAVVPHRHFHTSVKS